MESILTWIAAKMGIPPWLAIVLAAVIVQYMTAPKEGWTAIKDLFTGLADAIRNAPRRFKSEWNRVNEKIGLLEDLTSPDRLVREGALIALGLPLDAKIDVAREVAIAQVKQALKSFGRGISGIVEDVWNTFVDAGFVFVPWVIKGLVAYRNRKK